jgi:hypothetical protein
MRSANMTGQVILVTLVGLSCGLDLPHVAVLATAFGWVLMYILEWKITYSIDVRALPDDRLMESVLAYRKVLKSNGCRIIGEKKRPGSGRVIFIFRPDNNHSPSEIRELLENGIEPELRGLVDWKID